ncbi:MAG: tRNA (adenosine(37)-N6)-threonylcarbamoyltransferase complex ATPase subunit type 1 TsaE [Candidatus Sericytochromatia bacterium]
MEKQFYLNNEEKTIELGKVLGQLIESPCLIYLEGDLGAGKTHLTKGIASGLGIEEDITSPTFTLINEYIAEKIKLYHLDLYRLDSLNQVLNLGVEDFIDTDKSIVIMEWSDKLNGYKLSDRLIEIKLLHQEIGRQIIISTDNSSYKKILGELENVVNTWN